MKIQCKCGYIILDQTDFLSYKAYLLADQDQYDLWDAIDQHIETLATKLASAPHGAHTTAIRQAIHNARTSISSYTRRAVYQCASCGRLFVDDAGFNSQIFVPQNDLMPKNLLRSCEGDQWKRPLRGHWNAGSNSPGKGELWWGPGEDDQGYEEFADLETLRRRYFVVFARLRDKKILRDAFLRRGDAMLHQWPS